MKECLKNGILPIAAMVLILFITNEIYMVDGKADFIRLWMFVGIPFGMVKVKGYLAPLSFDLVYVLGTLLMYFAICGFFGGFIAIATMIQAIMVIIKFVVVLVSDSGAVC